MIVGGGTIAYYLARRLLEVGIHTKIIDQDPARCEHLSELLPKVPSSAVTVRMNVF